MLNTNGATDAAYGLMAGEGVIGENDGGWVSGFVAMVGADLVLLEEPWAILHRVPLATGKGLKI